MPIILRVAPSLLLVACCGIIRSSNYEENDLFCYILAQFSGGLFGISIAAKILETAIADPSINYIVTMPGSSGAIGAECTD